jgi:hypothetical protein
VDTIPTIPTPEPSLNLYDYALERAQESARRRELPTVALESGLDYSWLSKFARGKIPGASYKMVDALAMYYRNRSPAPPPAPPADDQAGRAAA